MQRPWRGLLMAAILSASLVPSPLFANVCQNLSAELARIERSLAGGSFGEASRRQQSELASARAQKNRCVSAENCASLATLVASMEANLAALERRAKTGRGDQQLTARRSEINKRLQAAQCGREAPARTAQANAFFPASGLLAWLGQGASIPQAAPPDPSATSEPARPAIARPPRLRGDEARDKPAFRPRGEDSSQPHFSGSYRTLCVRSCDGYYWPVSYQTSSGSFQRDAEMCRSACPGSEVALYVHRNPGGSSDDAVSLRGRPYAALKTAYRFRREFDAACTCKVNGGVLAVTLAKDVQGPPDLKPTLTQSSNEPLAASTLPETGQRAEDNNQLGLRGPTPPQLVD